MNNLSTNEPKTILDLIEKSELHLDSDTPKQYFDYMEDRVMNQIRSHQNSAQPSINKLPWYLTAAASISLIVQRN
ncbi:MAG: hypothetical protein MUE53_02915 [Chitinophagales bacterium]|nr:hypothetical protein [Chitinophagales bacterium]